MIKNILFMLTLIVAGSMAQMVQADEKPADNKGNLCNTATSVSLFSDTNPHEDPISGSTTRNATGNTTR